jgi:putative ABC transport system permease protein
VIFKIAFRNIFRQKRRTVLTVLTMFGGFSLAAVSIGWVDGTYSHTIDMFTRSRLGHIQIHRRGYLDKPSIYKTIDHYLSLGDTLQKVKGVQCWAPRLYSAAVVSCGDKSSAAQVVGVDPAMEDRATHFSNKTTRGRSLSDDPSGQAMLGEGLAMILDASPGDTVVVVSQAADGSIANDLYVVAGLLSTGDKALDRTYMYLHLKDAQDLFALDGRVHEIAVIVYHLGSVDAVAAAISKAIKRDNLEVATWKEFSKSFYRAMKADKRGNWIMLFVILLVVAVGVLNTVLMTVMERRREYGVMRAIGTTSGQVIKLVLAEVLIMALIGIAFGAVAGYIGNYLLSVYGIPMPEALTYGGVVFNKAYAEINARSFYIPAICVLITALAVALPPAVKAARTAPARAMRMH